MIAYGSLLLAGCSVSQSDAPTTTWDIDNPHSDYPELTKLTKITKDILDSSKQLNKQATAAYPVKERLKALDDHIARIRPHLSAELALQLAEYRDVYKNAFDSGVASQLYETAEDDPLLDRKWQPDSEVIDWNTDSLPSRVVTVNELLVSGKIWTGYQGKTDLRFIQQHGVWKVSEISISRRLDYDDAKWETNTTSSLLRDRVLRIQKKKEENKLEQARPRKPSD